MYCLALDFDGVICDSQEECFKTAGYLFSNYYPNIDINHYFNKYSQRLKLYRSYVINGEDYFLIMEAVFNKITFKNQSEFNMYKLKKKDLILEIRTQFYQTRKKLIQLDLISWLIQNPIYNNIDVFDFELSEDDMGKLNNVETKYRFVDPSEWWGIPYFN